MATETEITSAREPGQVPVLVTRLGVRAEGAVLTSHHLNRDRDYRRACAVVEPDLRQPGRVVPRNLTDRTWTVAPDGEEPKQVTPNQRLGLTAGMPRSCSSYNVVAASMQYDFVTGGSALPA